MLVSKRRARCSRILFPVKKCNINETCFGMFSQQQTNQSNNYVYGVLITLISMIRLLPDRTKSRFSRSSDSTSSVMSFSSTGSSWFGYRIKCWIMNRMSKIMLTEPSPSFTRLLVNPDHSSAHYRIGLTTTQHDAVHEELDD